MIMDKNNIKSKKKVRVVGINLGDFGSTGYIMTQIGNRAIEHNFEYYIAVPEARAAIDHKIHNPIIIGRKFTRRLSAYASSITGLDSCFSVFSTLKFLKILNKIKPDMIHLHNMHFAYINLPLLYHYIKKHNIKVIWTLHDCWSFTGHCPHFIYEKCDKWKTGCYDCPRYNLYPKSMMDNSRFMWKIKKHLFCGIKSAVLITPSQWLAKLVKESYLKEYPVMVINNGIDLAEFKPIQSDFREKYNIGKDKYIILGVAFSWGERKGLDVFLELSKRLPDKYQIVLVGTNDAIDEQLPENIISIHRTYNKKELIEIYTAADVFVNATREDNFPTVNIEALACGIPVITFDTGGSPECIDNTCGIVVACDDLETLLKKINYICSEVPFSKEACINRAKKFDMNDRYEDYIQVYEKFFLDEL